MLVKERDLIVSLIEFWGEDNLVPNGQTYVVIKQLIGERWLVCQRRRGHEGLFESFGNIIVHVATADIDDSSMDRSIILEIHAGGYISRVRNPRNRTAKTVIQSRYPKMRGSVARWSKLVVRNQSRGSGSTGYQNGGRNTSVVKR